MHTYLPPGAGLLALPLFAFVCLGGTASAQNLNVLSDYSVVVSGNLSTNSDIEGRTIVGGNLTSSNSANFGIRLQNKVSKGNLVLRVGGNIASGNPIQLNAGSLELGGSSNGRIINYNGGGSMISNPGVSYSGIMNDLTAASQNLAMYGANSTALLISNGPGQPGPFRLNASPDPSGLAVFHINANEIFGNSLAQQIELATNRAINIVINIAGQTVNWNAGNMVGDLAQEYWRERVVWNFYEATSINFGSKNMMGQILAPNATVTTSGVIDGSIFAKNLTTTSEVHLPGYNGSLTFSKPSLPESPFPGTSPSFPSNPEQSISAPEPSSFLLGLLGAVAMLSIRRRKP